MPTSYAKPTTLCDSSPFDVKGEKFSQWMREIGGKTHAVCIPSKGNEKDSMNYGESTFNLTIQNGTGIVEGDKKWLAFTTSPTAQGQLFEAKILSKEGAKGWKSNQEDVKNTSNIIDKWVKDGCNVLFLVNGIPTLETLVELTQGKLFAANLRVPFNEAPTPEQVESAKKLIEFQIESGDFPTADDPDYINCMEAGLLTILYLNTNGRDYKSSNPKLDIEGELPSNIKLLTPIPQDIKVAGSGGGKSGGYTQNINAYAKYAERLGDFYNAYADEKLKAIAENERVSFINLALSLSGCTPLPLTPIVQPVMVYEEEDHPNKNGHHPFEGNLLEEYIAKYPEDVPKGYDIKSCPDPDLLGQLLFGTINGKDSSDRGFKAAIKAEGLDSTGNPWKLDAEGLAKAVTLLD